MMSVAAAVYGVGVACGVWRGDAAPAARVALALLWPIGPVAFVATVAILMGASLIAFPIVAVIVAAAAAALAIYSVFASV